MAKNASGRVSARRLVRRGPPPSGVDERRQEDEKDEVGFEFDFGQTGKQRNR